MGYLIAAILCSSGVTLCLRFSKNEKDSHVTLAANYMVASVISFLLMKDRQVIPVSSDQVEALMLGIINGSLFVITLVINRMNIRKNGTPLAASFSHLGVLVPIILSMIIYGEQPTGKQWIGVGLAVLAILVINVTPSKESRAKAPWALILLFVMGGCTDMMSKIFERRNIPQCDNLYLWYTFTVALIICLVWGAIRRSKIHLYDVILGVVLGIFNYGGSFFLLRAVIQLPAFIVYPVYSVGVIVVINFVNRFILKETISKQQYVGMAIICISLLFL